ncbi:E3 ubiquitin-protein ligase ZSWIM2 [Leuresthes tenuis]|uniref:E3 ubiquitin-protein ligase ZSWIM2 n=1 Tax=Leuresthes tenuis TaxID=355514 RepID=UPI003B508533
MFRKTAWRNTIGDAVGSHQDQALGTTMLLLKSYGPAAFLLREDGESRNFKVCLGDPHTCTCPVFTKEQELCKHICWVLLRKFRLPREHEYSFQLGLVERQLLELLQGLHQTKSHRTDPDPATASGSPGQTVPGQEAGSVCRKVIQAQDVCPICQEELLQKKQPACYCRFGCGNNVHISCMKVWADHQKLSGMQETVKCPLCREDFSSLKLLHEQVKNTAKLFTAAERERPERHLGVLCQSCRVWPVTGRCFKCTVCRYFYLCEDCAKRACHPQHPLASRSRRSEKWLLAADDATGGPNGATCQPEHDGIVAVAADTLSDSMLKQLPAVRVRSGSRLLDEGLQCRICLQSFSLGEFVRALPCHHKFHTECVDRTLRVSNSCPLDGYVIYSPSTRRTSDKKSSPNLSSSLSSDCAERTENNLKDLFVPGVALRAQNTKASPALGALISEVLTDSSRPLNTPQKLTTDRLQGSHITGSESASAEGQNKTQKKIALFMTGSSFSHARQNACTGSTNKTPKNYSSASNIGRTEGRKVKEADLFIGPSRQESN